MSDDSFALQARNNQCCNKFCLTEIKKKKAKARQGGSVSHMVKQPFKLQAFFFLVEHKGMNKYQ